MVRRVPRYTAAMLSRALLYLSIAASAVYLATGNALVKGCAVGVLAVVAWRSRGARRDANVLALALAFSTAGGIVLDLDPRMFAFGLGAFLMAHLTYIALFLRNRSVSGHTGWRRIGAVLAVLAFSAGLSAWIVPSVGNLAVAVVLYICALTGM